MPNMFTALAQRATTLSPIMEGRDKITTEAIIKKYPDGITLDGFDMVTTPDKDGNPNTYPVFTFAEDPSVFLYGGKALHDVATLWLSHLEGDIEATSTALKASGGVKVKFTSTRTSAGRNFTKIEVIG